MNKYKITIKACFVGYIVQGIVNNFLPLLFLMFNTHYSIPLSKITLLVTVNFAIQLFVDLSSIAFVDRIGYRKSLILAHLFAGSGLVLLTILPELFGDAFWGLLISVLLYAVGGGLLEVLVSPVVESCPSDNKETTMSLLHSFYSWGQVGVVLISTLFFKIFSINAWKIMAIIWAIIPFANMFLFMKVPLTTLDGEGGEKMTVKALFSSKLFWVFMLMMMCAGASELGVSQWASAFAEKGLNIDKTMGDLLGPMMFAVLMGISRVFYGKFGDKIDLRRFITGSSALCVVSYLAIALIPNSFVALAGCALCGLSVGIMWPGTYSRASAAFNGGTTAMFALLALAGDMGCTTGPTLIGLISGAFSDNLKIGFLVATIFPLILLVSVILNKDKK